MVMRLALLLVVAALAGCGPSQCEIDGGRLQQTGLLPIFTGKVMILVPQYRCEK